MVYVGLARDWGRTAVGINVTVAPLGSKSPKPGNSASVGSAFLLLELTPRKPPDLHMLRVLSCFRRGVHSLQIWAAASVSNTTELVQ